MHYAGLFLLIKGNKNKNNFFLLYSMLNLTAGSSVTVYVTTEEKRIDVMKPRVKVMMLCKFTHSTSKKVTYAYGQNINITDRYTSFEFFFNPVEAICEGRINLAAGSYRYDLFEVTWQTHPLSCTPLTAPLTELQVLPLDNDNGVVQGLIETGKVFVKEALGTEEVQYVQRQEPFAPNIVHISS